MDDANLGGPAESVFADIRKCVTELKIIGLEINLSNCEVINMSYPVDEFTELVTKLVYDFFGLKRTELADMELLGAAMLDQAVKKAIANKLHTCNFMTYRLQQLDTHTGFFLLKNALSLHRLLFLLRSSPCYRHSDDLAAYDECTVAQQSRHAMSNSTISVGSMQSYLSVVEASDFGLLVIWPSKPTCLLVSPVDAWHLLFFIHHLILRSNAQTMSLRPGHLLAYKFQMTPSDNVIGTLCFSLLK